MIKNLIKNTNMNKSPLVLIVALALLVSTALVVPIAIAQETIAGTISAIDSEAMTVIVTIDETSTTLNVTNETVITVDREATTFEDLEVGMYAVCSYDPATMNVITMDATSIPPKITGTISAIDAENMTITVNETVLNIVTNETVITIDGAEATFDDLEVGMHAVCSYDPETMNAITIDATSGLPEIEVIVPNGGEILSDVVITQINATNPVSDILNLEWLISSDTGETWSSLYNDTSGVSPYFYDLNTTQFPNGNEYLIKGVATNDVGVTAEDTSDGTFEIRN
jgi:hypothetical protein